MSNWELKEKSTGELTVKVEGEAWTKACEKAFRKIANDVTVQGFRKGKAPKKILEKRIPKSQVHMEAVDAIANTVLQEELKAHDLEIVSRPSLDLGDVSDSAAVLIYRFAVKPEVKLGEYKGLKYNLEDISVTEEELANELDTMRERYAEFEVKEGPAENKDTVVIDYVGSIDGLPFDGGADEGHELVLGSGAFIPGFEDQLVGVSAGEEKDVSVTFPEDYHAADLAGKEAVFKVNVKEVKTKVLPELNDEFAEDVNMPDVTNVEELKAKVRERLENSRKSEAVRKADEDLFARVAENAEVDIPDQMIEDEMNNHVQEMQQQMQSYGISLTDYMRMMGLTPETMKEQFRADSEKQVKMRLVLEAIGKAENLEITDEEVEKEIQTIADMYQMSADQVKTLLDPQILKNDVLNQKAYQFVRNSAEGVPAEEKAAEEAPEPEEAPAE